MDENNKRPSPSQHVMNENPSLNWSNVEKWTSDDINQAIEACKLHVAYEAVPADRGGSSGPKGKAWAAFIAARDAALQAPAPQTKEPVAWRWRSTLFNEWNLSDKPPVDQVTMERIMELNMVGLEWEALYASPAPQARVGGE